MPTSGEAFRDFSAHLQAASCATSCARLREGEAKKDSLMFPNKPEVFFRVDTDPWAGGDIETFHE